jgi:hypothetical protein
VAKFLESDGIHLSKEGGAVLGSNIKKAIDRACNYKRPGLDQNLNRPWVKSPRPFRQYNSYQRDHWNVQDRNRHYDF